MVPTLRGPAILLALLAVVCASLLLQRLRTHPATLRLAAGAVAFWMLLIGVLALHGFFSNFRALPPHLLLAILAPAVAFAIFSLASKPLRDALDRTPIYWLIAFQTFRVVVEIVLWRAYSVGMLPIQMTFEGRNVDILIGLTAPLAAWIYTRTRSRAFAVLWNLAGLASVLNIVIIAILSMPTPLRRFMNDPPNTLLTHFPFIYLPAVLVPAAYIAHILSLRQLLTKSPQTKV